MLTILTTESLLELLPKWVMTKHVPEHLYGHLLQPIKLNHLRKRQVRQGKNHAWNTPSGYETDAISLL
jgi:hypothetical protein